MDDCKSVNFFITTSIVKQPNNLAEDNFAGDSFEVTSQYDVSQTHIDGNICVCNRNVTDRT